MKGRRSAQRFNEEQLAAISEKYGAGVKDVTVEAIKAQFGLSEDDADWLEDHIVSQRGLAIEQPDLFEPLPKSPDSVDPSDSPSKSASKTSSRSSSRSPKKLTPLPVTSVTPVTSLKREAPDSDEGYPLPLPLPF